MGKTAVKNLTSQLFENTNKLLKKVSALRKDADNLTFSLDRIQKGFIRQENLKKDQEKQALDQELINSHRSSYVMPDDDVNDTNISDNINPENKVETKAQQQAVVDKQSQNDTTNENNKQRIIREKTDRKSSDTDKKQKREFQNKKEYSNDNRSRQPKRNDRTFSKNDNSAFGKDDEDDNKNRFKKKSSGASSKNRMIPSDFIPTEKEKASNYDPHKKNYERRDNDFDKQKRNKRIKTNQTYLDDDDNSLRSRKFKSKKKASPQQLMPVVIESAVMTGEYITVRDLSSKIGKPSNEILKQLIIIGVMATINNELDYDTAALVSSELGVELEQKLEQSAEQKLQQIDDVVDDEKDLLERPPVITIMGHVDHGKTSLLDYIRKSHVTSGEAGGITQHIGAYMVNVRDKMITFLDTPGHEAFTSMRARGAQATDIAIIVVAANDGVMPQTVEAINHAKAAEVPIIIAINKMDLDHANADRVKQELANYDLIPEEWGGDTIMVPISAHTGMGVDKLLDMVLLVAELQQYKANPNRSAKGVIIEAKLDKSRGPLATVLLRTGTLRIGDSIVAGTSSGNVRAMLNDCGENVTEAGPSMPVEISGFDEVPEAGDEMIVVEDSRLGKNVISERRDREKALKQSAGNKVTLENMFSKIEQGKQIKLNLIIKADVQGSVEAVKQALEKLSNDEVKVRILHSAVGAITNDDVNLASAFDAIIIGFNIRPNSNASEIAAKEGVDIRLYRVIYKAIEDIELAMKGMLEPEYEEVILGHAEVRDTFRISGVGTIAGAYVTDGKIQRNSNVRLLRDNIVIFDGKLSSLKRFKDDAKEVASNYECGVSLENFNDIKIGDVIECYIEQEIEK